MVELLKQGQYTPLPVERQILSIYAGTQGHLDDVPVDALRAFEEALHQYADGRGAALLTEIREKKEIADALRAAARRADRGREGRVHGARGTTAAA